MEIFNSLVDFFGLTFTATTFPELLQWLVSVIASVFIVCFIFRCLFTATWKIGKDLR